MKEDAFFLIIIYVWVPGIGPFPVSKFIENAVLVCEEIFFASRERGLNSKLLPFPTPSCGSDRWWIATLRQNFRWGMFTHGMDQAKGGISGTLRWLLKICEFETLRI
jgi:hypothetical protein